MEKIAKHNSALFLFAAGLGLQLAAMLLFILVEEQKGTVAENTNPQDRAESIGIFRLWRDLGYAIGAILTGIIADLISINASIIFIGLLTLASAFVICYRMMCGIDGSLKILDWVRHKQPVGLT